MSRARRSPYLALGPGLAGLAFSAVFVRRANAPGPVSAFYRMAIAALALSIPFARQQRRAPELPRRDGAPNTGTIPPKQNAPARGV